MIDDVRERCRSFEAARLSHVLHHRPCGDAVTARVPPPCQRSQEKRSKLVSYADRNDMDLIKDLVSLAPTEAKGYFTLSHAAERSDGLIPPKYREPMSIAGALTTQCAYCL